MIAAIFLPSLRGGGAERVMINLAKGLLKSGFSVDIVVANSEKAYDLPEGATLVDFGVRRVLHSILPLARYITERGPSVMISTMDHCNLATVYAKSLANRKDLRTILTIHTAPGEVIKSASDLKRKRVMPFLLGRAYRKNDYLVAVSNGVAFDISRVYRIPEERIAVIYNPVISQEMFSLSEVDLSFEWFQEPEVPVIVTAGRLSSPKDHNTLIDAFHLLRTLTEARLLILGEGSERDSLEKKVKQLGMFDDVRFLGFVSNPYYYFARSNVFVLSSFREGLPTVMIEALALGCKVVATDCHYGPKEILQGIDNCWLTPPGDSKELASALKRSLESEESPSVNLEKYSLKYATSEYIKLIRDDL